MYIIKLGIYYMALLNHLRDGIIFYSKTPLVFHKTLGIHGAHLGNPWSTFGKQWL